jgi:hypothetical protein
MPHGIGPIKKTFDQSIMVDPNDHHMKPPMKPLIIHLLLEHLTKNHKKIFEPNHPIANLVVSLSH